ncbi:MAG: hypothetical protein ACC661_08935, partial [Verrucomicrobiales bacterium]
QNPTMMVMRAKSQSILAPKVEAFSIRRLIMGRRAAPGLGSQRIKKKTTPAKSRQRVAVMMKVAFAVPSAVGSLIGFLVCRLGLKNQSAALLTQQP